MENNNIRIVCLGSSHTEGGSSAAGIPKDFENSWPGKLQEQTGYDILNAGEASYSIDFWPTKLLNVIDYYKPTHLIMEINRPEKLDVEISRDLTEKSPQDAKDYHPLLTRQNITSATDKTNQRYWPFRTSVSNSEAIDYYTIFNKLNREDVEEYYNGNFPKAVGDAYNELADGVITDIEKSWVADKLNEIVEGMGGHKKDLDLLINYLYFRAVYYAGSDQDMANYFQNINHMKMICDVNNIKMYCFTMHKKEWLDNQIYKDNYKKLWKDIWLFNDINFRLKGWVQERFSDKYKDTLCDSIHYYPWVWEIWCKEMLVPWVNTEWEK